MNSFAISDFVRRQTACSGFSYFSGTDEELLQIVSENFANATPGYRDGVILVPVNPDKFYSSIVILNQGDKLAGTFKARKDGEVPHKETRAVTGNPMPAKKVDIVLYSHATLCENNEQSSDADWEIISINASVTDETVPLTVGALMRNFFCEPGGTDTKMTCEEFVAALKVSRDFWRDKALLLGDNK